jgi:hypothetical protein
MRFAWALVVVASGCANEAASGSGPIPLPEVYPPVREATPSALNANPQYAAVTPTLLGASPAAGELGRAGLGLAGAVSLGTAVQERFYSGGPTAILRIVKDMDNRVAGLDTDPATHPCLTTTPVPWTYSLPAGQSFTVQLQCLEQLGAPGSPGAGWVAFGFDRAAAADAGPTEASDGNDFYLVEGQASGMGGAYHLSGVSGSVEAWISVADSTLPLNSQVIMHLLTDKLRGTLELALAGSAVGFCSGHLKANQGHLFVSGKTNAPPPPGAPMAGQYCDALRAGCFDTTALGMDLGEGHASFADISTGSFAIRTGLDASTDSGANVTPATIYRYFEQPPMGVPTF